MQIFLKSPTRSSSRGFTLVELLISIAIIGIVTSTVLVKYKSFDSTVLLKGAAYEIALTLREAQVKSIGAMGTSTSGNFNVSYGVSFDVTDAGKSTYTVFTYSTTTPYRTPRLIETEELFLTYAYPSVVQTYTFDREMVVRDICIIETSGETCNSLTDDATLSRLDISFRRPEFRSLFFADNADQTVDHTTTFVPSGIVGAKIYIGKDTNEETEVFVIEITSLGQITVCKEGSPNCS